MLKTVKRINRNRCSICNSETNLVYGSIMYGSICNDCMTAKFSRNSTGKAYLNGFEFMPEFEVAALFKSPYAKGVSTALMDIYGRYQAIVKKVSIDEVGNVMIQLDAKYKNNDCIISLWTTNSSEGLTVVYNITNIKSKHEILSRVFRIRGDKVYIDIPE